MTEWKPIESAPKECWCFAPVDLWLSWDASLKTMGMGDSFRVPDCHRENGHGDWGHMYLGRFTLLNQDYITHWMPFPDAPETL